MKKREKAPKKAKKAKEPRRPERTETGGLDYSVYYMKPPEYLAYLLLAAAGLFVLGYIFYRSVVLSAVVALLAFKYPPIRTRQIIAARRQKLNLQFKDMLYSLTYALGAGCSVERAMSAALEDMERQSILERLGWKFIRVRGSEYYRRPAQTIARIVSELNAAGIEPEAGSA